MRGRQDRDERGEKTVDRIPQHRHCKNCDKAIPYKGKFCDDACENDYRTRTSSEKKKLYLFYAISVVVLVGLMILNFF